MKLAMIGLGKMGGNMTTRLLRSGIEVVGYDRSVEVVTKLVETEGMVSSSSVADSVSKLGENGEKRIVWLMLPSGEPTEIQIQNLAEILAKGDIIIDGGNSNYKDSQRRGAWLAERGIGFMDAGTSGGIWGLENGYCLMVGATPEVAKAVEPILIALAPSKENGLSLIHI
jgi:6-phosphogluconate dehydrogenase